MPFPRFLELWAVWVALLVVLPTSASAQGDPAIDIVAEAGPAVHTAVQTAAGAAGESDAETRAIGRVDALATRATTLLEERAARGSQEAYATAAKREREALERLEEARAREQRERDEALRELRATEREIAERSLEQTREHSARLASIDRRTREHLDELAERKGRLLDALDAIPTESTQKVRRERVDPLFDRVLELRRDAHDQFRGAVTSVNEAEQRLAERESELDHAAEQLRRARQRMDDLENSQIWERRVAVAQARFELAKQRLLHQREVVEAYRERVRDYHSQFGFFAGTIEPLLDRISDERRDAYFSLGDSDNWEMAAEALGTGMRALEERVDYRLEQLDAAGLTTLEFWAWISGLIWNLAGLLILGYVAIRALVWLVDRLCAGVLRRRLLRRNATLLVKLAEMLRAVSRPTLVYIGIAFTANYAAQRIPELLGVVWIVDAVFIYWVVMQAARVAILPRSHRKEEGELSAEGLDYIDEADASNIADITGVDLRRARKLLNSVRVITVFWLFAAYLPDFLKPLTGITVLWWLLDVAATWGFIFVVYWVLSRWRDEIAALFEQLAGERLAPAVEFVKRHKARPWGVLVIAVTSLYVLFKEIAIIVRRYALETNVFKRLSALAFRTQIEMQNRAREGEADEARGGTLEPDYLRLFEERPLLDEPYLIDRPEYTEPVLEQFATWQRHQRSGSVALSGETGVGKTTLVNQVVARLGGEAGPVVRGQFDERITDRGELLEFMSELFELDEVPETVSEFVDVVGELDRRIVVLDDCQYCFSRHIERFGAIDALLDIVHLADDRHFFLLAFSRHAWRYVDRVEDRGHCFGRIVEIPSWEPDALQELIERRNEVSDYSTSFAGLVAAHADANEGEEESFDVIETSRGYFGYLHQFSGGIPRVAMLYWLESLRPSTRPGVFDVDLFERPATDIFSTFGDDHWFVLAALVQHGGLDEVELSEVMDRSRGFCARALDFFADNDVVDLDPVTGRARLSARYWRPVLRRLSSTRFLFGA